MEKEAFSIVKQERQLSISIPSVSIDGSENKVVAHADVVDAKGSTFNYYVNTGVHQKLFSSKDVTLDYSYYSLIVTGGDRIEGQSVLVSKERMFEHTSKEIKDQCMPMDIDAIVRLKSFPTVFAVENLKDESLFENQEAHIGLIQEIVEYGRDYEVFFETRFTIKQKILVTMASPLRINMDGFGEFKRMHWSVKNKNLVDILQREGYNISF